MQAPDLRRNGTPGCSLVNLLREHLAERCDLPIERRVLLQVGYLAARLIDELLRGILDLFLRQRPPARPEALVHRFHERALHLLRCRLVHAASLSQRRDRVE